MSHPWHGPLLPGAQLLSGGTPPPTARSPVLAILGVGVLTLFLALAL